MDIEQREMRLLDWAAEQRETDRNYRPSSYRRTKEEQMGCENYFTGCDCPACIRLHDYFNMEE